VCVCVGGGEHQLQQLLRPSDVLCNLISCSSMAQQTQLAQGQAEPLAGRFCDKLATSASEPLSQDNKSLTAAHKV
jgi:hypothetical protein